MSVNWSYYKYVAERCNRVQNEINGTISYEQLPYSYFSPLYERYDEAALNRITRAFLEPDKYSLPEYEDAVPLEKITAYYEHEFPADAVKPYKAQYEAIFHAINDPVSIIQGPPGTGKTETIVNILRQIYVNFGTSKTVAVVSNNSEAVDNVYSFIRESQLPVDADIRKHFAVLGNKSKRWSWCSSHKNYRHNDAYQLESAVLGEFPFFSSTIHSLRKLFIGMPDYQFDYVIIDESSQSSISLALNAMASARHLVVLGDTKQLSAIISEKMVQLTVKYEEKYHEIDSAHKEREEWNFLAACNEVFSGKVQPVLLDEHYRCHPSIIGFCNEYVYGGQLKPFTKCDDPDDFRIRAVWYEGDYHEKTVAPTGANEQQAEMYGNCNLRQIRIFLEEELPRYRELNKAHIQKQLEEAPDKQPENLSVAIIAPFKAQLNILRSRLEEMSVNALFEEELHGDDEGENEAVSISRDLPTLTVHKSQGRGYDIVYLLTVTDSNDALSEWAQRMRMINVAVSRAKKEFCIITSSRWMPDKLQNELTGYVLPVNKQEDRSGNLYFRNLLRYVCENCPLPRGDHGFHRSGIVSVFDEVSFMREKYHTGKDCNGANSAPARCMMEALKDRFSEYDISAEVPMSALEQMKNIGCNDEALRNFMLSSKFDFVLHKGSEVKLIIEVDGGYHRDWAGTVYENYTQPQLDGFKDEWIKALGAEAMFVRFSTNGETDNELALISEKLAAQDKPALTLDLDAAKPDITAKELLLQRRDEFIKERYYDTVEPLIDDEQYVTISEKFPDYSNEETTRDLDYGNAITRALYHCKYSTAYSFEYAMLWDIILRSFRGNCDEVKVCSFGCGSMVEAWSLAYARASLAEEYPNKGYDKLRLSFTGVDARDWVDRFMPAEDDEGSDFSKEFFSGINFKKGNATSSEILDRSFRANVLIFPKILNHIPSAKLQSMFRWLDLNAEECCICISHNMSSVQSEKALKKNLLSSVHSIMKQLEKKFEVCDDIFVMLGDDKEAFCKKWLGSDRIIEIAEDAEAYGISDHSPSVEVDKCYIFESSRYEKVTRFGDTNKDFKLDRYIQKAFSELDGALKSNDCGDRHTNCISTVRHIAFQVIRLRRKGK